MKLIKPTIQVREYRNDLQVQINQLIDFLPFCDCPNQQGKILKEVQTLRSKIRPLEKLNAVNLSKHIEITKIDLKSAINGNTDYSQHEYTPSDKQIVEPYRFSR